MSVPPGQHFCLLCSAPHLGRVPGGGDAPYLLLHEEMIRNWWTVGDVANLESARSGRGRGWEHGPLGVCVLVSQLLGQAGRESASWPSEP